MNIDALVNMPDEQFDQCAIQAFKRRDTQTHWWPLFLRPEVIEDTRTAFETAERTALEQARTPDRYPSALGFARKMQAALAEITLAELFGTTPDD